MQPDFQLHGSPIFIGPLAESFPVWFESQHFSQVFVLADNNTARACLPYFLEKTRLAGKIVLTEIEAGESHKNLASCESVWQAMLAAKLDRKALVLNLGGGVVGDMGGFCAAAWKRGVDFVQVPTTLLAMTDAAIGGKTGIDFQGVKNAIGIFQQPAAVFVDPAFLQTLPEREFRSGFAEVLKHALLGDFDVENQLSESSGFKLSESWAEILQKSIAVKVRIVEEDPLEKNLRMLLNFGHSIGHALESWFLDSAEPLTHGEAVAIGMVCESRIALARNHIEIADLVLRHFPHRLIPTSAFPRIWELMQQDKKNSSGTVRMAVPDEKPYSLKIIEPNQQDVEQALLFYNALKVSG